MYMYPEYEIKYIIIIITPSTICVLRLKYYILSEYIVILCILNLYNERFTLDVMWRKLKAINQGLLLLIGNMEVRNNPTQS